MFDAWQWLRDGGHATTEREAIKRTRIEACEESLIYLDALVQACEENPPRTTDEFVTDVLVRGQRERVQRLLSKLRGDYEGVDPVEREREMTRERVRRWRARRKAA
jgi:hypothetical protein